jgi:hypothetical protein
VRILRWIAGAMAITATVALAAWLLGFVAPLGPLGGGRLRGEVSTPPDDWSFADRVAEVRLETRRGLLPWSVTSPSAVRAAGMPPVQPAARTSGLPPPKRLRRHGIRL